MSERPHWQQQVRPRLAVSMFLAALVIAAVMLLLKFPGPELRDVPEFVVQLEPEVIEEAEGTAATDELIDPEPLATPPEEPVVAELPAPPEVAPISIIPAETDWQKVIKDAAREMVTVTNSDTSMHPSHAEAKRLAAINFAPSRAPVKKPIWENVETDNIGRTVLRNGECYRVLDDWRATYQDIQRELGQYIMHCDAVEDTVIDVKWVEDIKQNYAYLRNKDGELSHSELNELLRRPDLVAQE
ncbi:MAG: hypothetical protein ACR2QS_03240 [Woeseiaceae bacterium]